MSLQSTPARRAYARCVHVHSSTCTVQTAAFFLHWGSFPMHQFRFQVPGRFRRYSSLPSVRHFSCTCTVCTVLVHVLQPGAMVGRMRVWVAPSGGPVRLGLLRLHTRRTGRKACWGRIRCRRAPTDRRRPDSKNDGVEMTNKAVAMTMAPQLVRPAIDSQSLAMLCGR